MVGDVFIKKIFQHYLKCKFQSYMLSSNCEKERPQESLNYKLNDACWEGPSLLWSFAGRFKDISNMPLVNYHLLTNYLLLVDTILIIFQDHCGLFSNFQGKTFQNLLHYLAVITLSVAGVYVY